MNLNQTNRQTNYTDSDSDYSDNEQNKPNHFLSSYYNKERNEIDDESIDCEIVDCEPKKMPELILLTDDEDDNF